MSTSPPPNCKLEPATQGHTAGPTRWPSSTPLVPPITSCVPQSGPRDADVPLTQVSYSGCANSLANTYACRHSVISVGLSV